MNPGVIAHSAADTVATDTAHLNYSQLPGGSNALDDPFADLDVEWEQTSFLVPQ